jgi:hypothetical protein
VFPEFKAQPWAYWHTGLIIMDKEQTFSGGIPAVQLQVRVAAAPTDIALIGRGQVGFLAARRFFSARLYFYAPILVGNKLPLIGLIGVTHQALLNAF